MQIHDKLLHRPAKTYFLSRVLTSGDRVTVSREGPSYVIRGGFGTPHILAVCCTSPQRLEAHLDAYVANTEREMRR